MNKFNIESKIISRYLSTFNIPFLKILSLFINPKEKIKEINKDGKK